MKSKVVVITKTWAPRNGEIKIIEYGGRITAYCNFTVIGIAEIQRENDNS